MIRAIVELTSEQIKAVTAAGPPLLVNPQTREHFVLLPVDEYERLKAIDYDDSPWTREELSALAWAAGQEAGWDEMNEYDQIPEQP